jgi:hypothetical protein
VARTLCHHGSEAAVQQLLCVLVLVLLSVGCQLLLP